MNLTKNCMLVQNRPNTMELCLGALYVMHQPVPRDYGNHVPSSLDKSKTVIFMLTSFHDNDNNNSITHIMCRVMFIDSSASLDMVYEEPNSVKITDITSNEKIILTNKDVYNIFIEKGEYLEKENSLKIKFYNNHQLYNGIWQKTDLKLKHIFPLNRRILDISLWALLSIDMWQTYHLKLQGRNGVKVVDNYNLSDRHIAIEKIQKRLTMKRGEDVLNSLGGTIDNNKLTVRRIRIDGDGLSIVIGHTNIGEVTQYRPDVVIKILNENTIIINGYTHTFYDLIGISEFFTTNYTGTIRDDWILLPDLTNDIRSLTVNAPIIGRIYPEVTNNNSYTIDDTAPLDRIRKKLANLDKTNIELVAIYAQIYKLKNKY